MAGDDAFTLGAVLAMGNVLCFVVLQTAFFWYVGSREVERVIEHKAEPRTPPRDAAGRRPAPPILRSLRRRMQQQGLDEDVLALDATLVRARREREPVAATAERHRHEDNRALTLRVMGPVVLGLVVIILLLCLYNRHAGHRFATPHWWGLGLVPAVYVFELLFFFLVIERYVMVGDYEIVRDVSGLREQ